MSTTAPAGIKLILDAINERRSVMAEVNFVAQFRNTARHQVFRDATVALIDTYDRIKSQGMMTRAEIHHPEMAKFLAYSREHMGLLMGQADDQNDPELDHMLGYLVKVVETLSPYIRNAQYIAPPAQSVQPLPVHIVSQPATASVQTVERDAHDEITRTVTITQPVA